MQRPELSLILPCFNEAEHFSDSIRRIVSALTRLNRPFEIIFVEDKSTDNTEALVKSFVARHKKLPSQTIFHTVNQGRGASVKDGIIKARGKYVGFLDIDLEIDTIYLAQFLNALDNGFDVVCAVRTYSFSSQNRSRWIASLGYRMLMRTILGVPLQDTEAGYKFFNRKRTLQAVKETRADRWFWDTEIMVTSYVHGLRIKEIPVSFVRRSDKTSTVRLLPDTFDYLHRLLAFRAELSAIRSNKNQ